MMTTLTVLAILAAVPLVFGVLLAVTLGAVMALHFALDWVRGRAPDRRRAPCEPTRRYDGAAGRRCVPDATPPTNFSPATSR
jgi:hypothetical protein